MCTSALTIPIFMSPSPVHIRTSSTTPTPIECDGCKWLVGRVQEYTMNREQLLSNLTENAIETNVCAHIPSKEANICDELVEKYIPVAVDTLVKKFTDPAFICSEVVPLCSNAAVFQHHDNRIKNASNIEVCSASISSIHEYLSKNVILELTNNLFSDCKQHTSKVLECETVSNYVSLSVVNALTGNATEICESHILYTLPQKKHETGSGRRILVKVSDKPAPAPKKAVPSPAPAPKKAVPSPAPSPKAVPAPAPSPKAVPAPSPKAVSAPKVEIVVEPPPKAAPAPAPTTKVASPSMSVSNDATKYQIYITCDNEFNLYRNGNHIGRGNDWMTTYRFDVPGSTGDVIAIDGLDKGGPAAFIGQFYGTVTKPSDWKCSEKHADGWNTQNFDDSKWANAVSYGKNSDRTVWMSVSSRSRPNIPADAEWLWTSNNLDHERVYCRYFPFGKFVADAAKSSDMVVREITDATSKSNQKLSNFQQTITRLIKETSDQQLKLEEENKKNLKEAGVTLSSENSKLETQKNELKKLLYESNLLNSTIQTHYRKIISDTAYLSSLDQMKPEFFKSLDNLWMHIRSVKTTVNTKLINDDYKVEMIHLLEGIHVNVQNISGFVATAFINHYNKYKALIQKENTQYSSEILRLNALSAEYKVMQQKVVDNEKERTRIQTLMTHFKDAYDLSLSQRVDFDELAKKIVTIFDNKKCTE